MKKANFLLFDSLKNEKSFFGGEAELGGGILGRKGGMRELELYFYWFCLRVAYIITYFINHNGASQILMPEGSYNQNCENFFN